MAVVNPILSRQSHHKKGGTGVRYEQARELHNRVMDATQRDHLHKNTGTVMNAGVARQPEHDVLFKYGISLPTMSKA